MMSENPRNAAVQYITGDSNLANDRLDELAELYASDFVDPPLKGREFYSADRFRERLLGQYVKAPNFRIVVALASDEMAGFVYGCSLPEGSPWWDGLEEPLPKDVTRETGSRTFALLDLLVARSWRGQGIASELHRRVLEGRTEERVTLLSSPPQMPAYEMWKHWGYEKVGQLKPAPDANTLHAFLKI